MRTVIAEAGDTLIAIVVGLMLLTLVFGVRIGSDTVGLIDVISACVEVQSEDYGSYIDSVETENQLSIAPAVLSYNSAMPTISTMTEVNMLEYVLVTEGENVSKATELRVGEAAYILNITKKIGGTNESLGSITGSGNIYSFVSPGIYSMQIKLVDANNKVVFKNIDFTVL